jgi:hypothetical protein
MHLMETRAVIEAADTVDRATPAMVSLSTVFDVETQENWSRYVMFRDTFSSSDVRRKIFISTETKGMADRPTELRALNMVGSKKWHEIWGCSTADRR